MPGRDDVNLQGNAMRRRQGGAPSRYHSDEIAYSAYGHGARIPEEDQWPDGDILTIHGVPIGRIPGRGPYSGETLPIDPTRGG